MVWLVTRGTKNFLFYTVYTINKGNKIILVAWKMTSPGSDLV